MSVLFVLVDNQLVGAAGLCHFQSLGPRCETTCDDPVCTFDCCLATALKVD